VVLEISILARPPVRPVDLGLGPDDRRLSALVHRVRVRTADREQRRHLGTPRRSAPLS
jgi:hypothetical protein